MLRRLLVGIGVFALLEAALLIWLAWVTAWYVPVLAVGAAMVVGIGLLRIVGLPQSGRLGSLVFAGAGNSDIFRGLLLILAALLFILPGLISDAVAILLLVPGGRRQVGRQLAVHMTARFLGGLDQGQGMHAAHKDDDVDDNVIEGRVVEPR